jgi:hypothetical protein
MVFSVFGLVVVPDAASPEETLRLDDVTAAYTFAEVSIS